MKENAMKIIKTHVQRKLVQAIAGATAAVAEDGSMHSGDLREKHL